MKWETLRKYSQKAGKEVLAVAEATYKTFKDPELSWRHKTLIFASIVYLLSPLDAVPDFLPGGYADDLSVMLASLMAAGQVGKKHLQECRLKHGLVVKVEEKT